MDMFVVESFTAELVWLGAAGIIKHKSRDKAKFTSQNVFILRKALASEPEFISTPADGICGAPVIHQEDKDLILDCGHIGFSFLNMMGLMLLSLQLIISLRIVEKLSKIEYLTFWIWSKEYISLFQLLLLRKISQSGIAIVVLYQVKM